MLLKVARAAMVLLHVAVVLLYVAVVPLPLMMWRLIGHHGLPSPSPSPLKWPSLGEQIDLLLLAVTSWMTNWFLMMIQLTPHYITPPEPVRGRLRFCELLLILVLLAVACWISFRIIQYFHKLDSACSKVYHDAVPFSNRTRFILLPEVVRKWCASAVIEEMKKLRPKLLPQDDERSKRVHRILTKLVQAAERIIPNTRDILNGWEVMVVKDKEKIEACCMPGCKIAVYTGMLNKLSEDDDAELATVLSHEVSHAIASHTVEDLTTEFLWSWVVRRYCIFLMENLMMFRRAAEFVMDAWCEYCVMRPLSRRSEYEADHIGLLLLAAAGYDPSVAPKVWKKLGNILRNSEWDNYTSTHPSFKKREQYVSQDLVMEKAKKLYRDSASHTL